MAAVAACACCGVSPRVSSSEYLACAGFPGIHRSRKNIAEATTQIMIRPVTIFAAIQRVSFNLGTPCPAGGRDAEEPGRGARLLCSPVVTNYLAGLAGYLGWLFGLAIWAGRSRWPS